MTTYVYYNEIAIASAALDSEVTGDWPKTESGCRHIVFQRHRGTFRCLEEPGNPAVDHPLIRSRVESRRPAGPADIPDQTPDVSGTTFAELPGLARRSALRAVVLTAALVCASFAQLSSASPDADIRLQIINQQIEDNPGDAELLVHRGELHAEMEQWGRALLDFDRAAEADPNYTAVDFHRGRLFLATGDDASSKLALESYLDRSEAGPGAVAARTLSYFFLGEIHERRRQWP